MEVYNLKINNTDNFLVNLEVLNEIVGDSKVVGLGEGVHFVNEFWQVRQHLFEYLHEKCTFNIFLMEFGFAEGFKLSEWVNGAGEKSKLTDYGEAAAKWGAGETMRWLREYNKTKNNGIRFAGIDIPEAGGTIIPALMPVSEYLKKVDPSLIPLITELIKIAENFADLSSAKAITKWKSISAVNQFKLYAELNKVYLRFKTLKHLYIQSSSRNEYDKIIRCLDAAIYSVYILQASAELFAGSGLPFDISVREYFMANSVLWHLNNSEANARIVIFAHNNHIQKTPVQYGNYITAYPMGFYLNEYLGEKYKAIGITTTDSHIPEMELTDESPVGFKLVDKEIGTPVKNSFESLLIDKGFQNNLSFSNLQDKIGNEKINCFRSQSTYITTSSIQDTFDGMVSIPKISQDKSVSF